MTQYDITVENHRQRLEAETWAKAIKTLHAHSLTSMWYDTRGFDGSVIDTEYNDGSIRREILKTGEVIYFGESLTGEQLADAYGKHGH